MCAKHDCTQTNTGLFEEFHASTDEKVEKIGKRWSEIKTQAMDSGFMHSSYFVSCVWYARFPVESTILINFYSLEKVLTHLSVTHFRYCQDQYFHQTDWRGDSWGAWRALQVARGYWRLLWWGLCLSLQSVSVSFSQFGRITNGNTDMPQNKCRSAFYSNAHDTKILIIFN